MIRPSAHPKPRFFSKRKNKFIDALYQNQKLQNEPQEMTTPLANLRPAELSPQLQVKLLEKLKEVGPYGFPIVSTTDFMECTVIDRQMNLITSGCKGTVITALELFRHIQENYPGWSPFIPILVKSLISARRVSLNTALDTYVEGRFQKVHSSEIIGQTTNGFGYYTRDVWCELIIALMATYDLGKMLPFQGEVRTITNLIDCMGTSWQTYALLAALLLNHAKICNVARVDYEVNFKLHLTPDSFLRAHPSVRLTADDEIFTNFPIGPV